ncbi:hypothetical protein PFISCL1PPCAC_4000, partial [Pristionchus fissidentatus]
RDKTAWVPRLTLALWWLFLCGATVLAQLLVGTSVPAALGGDARRMRAYGIELISGGPMVLVVADDGQRLCQTAATQSTYCGSGDEDGEEKDEQESGVHGGGVGRLRKPSSLHLLSAQEGRRVLEERGERETEGEGERLWEGRRVERDER